jgi:hypothetical protein
VVVNFWSYHVGLPFHISCFYVEICSSEVNLLVGVLVT